MAQVPHFINGARTAGTAAATQPVYRPATGEITADVVLGDGSDARSAVDAAERAFPIWSQTNPQRRARVLAKWVELIEQHKDELAATLSSEHGKTLADAYGDIQRGVEVVEFAVGAPQLLKGEFTSDASQGVDVHSLRQPLGVVVGITPFNFPAMIPLWKAGIALAAGNTFVLKPSERDPSVPVRLAELALEAGLPEGALNVVQGGKPVVDALIEDSRVQAVAFVGSTPIAQSIYAHATSLGKRAQCFGGAKNHLIIMPDADIDLAADALIGAAFGSAGERCMAISVAVPVGQDTADRLVAALQQRMGELTMGTSDDPEADYSALVTAEAKARVEDYIQTGVDEGAELLVDGRGATVAGHENGFYVGATLFDRVSADMRIYREEIFGPVLSVIRAETFDDAVRLPSEHEFGNGVSIFTRDGQAARDFATQVDVGMVGINVPIPVPIAYYSFGGWKASGFGDLNQYGTDGLKFYTKVKTVTTRWPSSSSSQLSFVMPEGS